MEEKIKIPSIEHPEYSSNKNEWEKFRFTFKGGQAFINEYLKKFSSRENNQDFADRKKLTYNPALAKAAIIDIRNAIFQRMVDISRKGGSPSYQIAIAGLNRGVDLKGNSMNGFIGRIVLPELLSIGKVGIYIDKEPISNEINKKDSFKTNPYLYIYKAEDIRSWRYNKQGQLAALLLQDTIYTEINEYGLIDEQSKQFRLLTLLDNGVKVEFFDEDGELLHKDPIILNLNRIPFVIVELSSSLLIDAANIQIAFLQLASSDINYAMKANFPFYTEQYNQAAEMGALLRSSKGRTLSEQVGVTGQYTETGGELGTFDEAQKAKDQELNVGALKGRRYPQGLNRPEFINPSSEPLKVSMEKQDKMARLIRQVVNLSVAALEPRRASAESKKEDNRSLEAGLSYIGLELEYMEREIAKIWSLYEDEKEIGTISYPKTYDIRTDEDRRKEALELTKLQESVPSKSFQKEVAKQIAETTIGSIISNTKLKEIQEEIEKSEILVTDHETIRADHKAGFISTKSASKALGYPDNETDQAKKDHIERLKYIAESQTSKKGDLKNPKERGVPDLDKE